MENPMEKKPAHDLVMMNRITHMNTHTDTKHPFFITPIQICLGTHTSYHGNLKGPVLQHTKTHGHACTRRPPVM